MEGFWSNVLASSVVVAVFFVAWMVFYYFLSYNNAKKRKLQLEEFHKSLKIGDKVLFGGGLYGRVVKIDKEDITVEIAEGTEVLVSHYGIQAIIEDRKT